MIMEVTVLNVRQGMTTAFEAAFREAAPIIASMPGCISHRLQRCIETPDQYLLLVEWTSLEAHTVGFRSAPEYSAGKRCCITSTTHSPPSCTTRT
jgi:heme-degrading monooxygenase HmoA